jgi:hypothetical protein
LIACFYSIGPCHSEAAADDGGGRLIILFPSLLSLHIIHSFVVLFSSQSKKVGKNEKA